MLKRTILTTILFLPLCVFAQMYNHWSQNFNDESSLLAGAVVSGGAGASSIFYNPATISEIKTSKLSLNASLFSVDLTNATNAWGEGLNYQDSRIYVIPRFLSYQLKPRRIKNWSFEVAFMNVSNLEFENVIFTQEEIDILPNSEGKEIYTGDGALKNRYRDDWIGIGGSRQLNEKLSIGASVFTSFVTQRGFYNLTSDARPANNNTQNYHIASFNENELIKYNDYRLLAKFGVLYTRKRTSFGLNITSPAISGIYSDGKIIQRRRSQNNISDPETGSMMQDYLILDYAEKKEVAVRTKTPLSVSFGFNVSNKKANQTFYTTAEYFFNVNPYVLAKANRTPNLNNTDQVSALEENYWLTFIDGASPVFNFGLGYKWHVKEDLIILAGFKTDFQSKPDFESSKYSSEFNAKSLTFNKYHFTSGSTLHVFGQDITAGLQYSLGRLRNQQQIVNLSDPVEYNTVENKPLQGTRTNTMNSRFNSFSIYFAATLNFNNRDDENLE